MEIQHGIDNIKLTSGEIAELFNTYITNKALICVLSHFSAKVQDPDIGKVIRCSLEISEKLTKKIINIYTSVNHPVPKAFTDEDVNINAKRIYSDTYMLTYVRSMLRFALIGYSEARASCTRSDVRDFFDEAIYSTIELFDTADAVLINKGIFSKSPYIPIPDNIDFVEKQSFLNGFLGEKRTLNASEANRLYLNFQRNVLGEALLLGFIQTTDNKEIQDYFIRGVELAKEHMKITSSFLDEVGLDVPRTLAQEVTDSTERVFSDKLMLFHVVTLDSIGFSTNGTTLSRVMRTDLSLSISRLMTEIALYSEDGLNIMIKNKWFERIPQAINRKELTNV